MNGTTATQTAATLFGHLTALPAWLQLSHRERTVIGERTCDTALRAHPAVSTRWIDVDAFEGGASDILLATTPDLQGGYADAEQGQVA